VAGLFRKKNTVVWWLISQTNWLAVGGQLCFHEMIRQEKRNSRKEKI
jgi:hypothetical protein